MTEAAQAPRLKECPFCGGEAELLQWRNMKFYVMCQTCSCRTDYERCEADAITAWNDRTAPAPVGDDLVETAGKALYMHERKTMATEAAANMPWEALPQFARGLWRNSARAVLDALPTAPAGHVLTDFAALLYRQREWSTRTFGPGPRHEGCIDHIRKECREVEANPSDMEEWIDIAMLAIDGAWREGHSPEAILAQYQAKLEKNMARTWPDWRTADTTKAVEHNRLTSTEPKS